MWQKLKYKYGLRVRRDTVAFLLKVADPEGVENRLANRLKRRNYQVPGADFLLHVDGYDKLKPFGFAIHGARDGFSRADAGGKNVIIGSLQRCLRADHDDTHAGSKSFIVGKSTHNQCIEAFWGQLRKHSMNFFIEYLKQMKDDQSYDGSEEDTEILQFCFGPIIKNSLDDSKELWNQHSIRKQTYSTHNGVPFAMYNLPEMWGGKSCKKPVDLAAVDRLMEEFTDDPEYLTQPWLKLLVGSTQILKLLTALKMQRNYI
ncbi:hypothetical protein QAD02_024452 [Eretmocerus hayati]|uniref:Uncharacterized protein n=1 Tax=Eretmocerus hayati TaxID=131215 RepID=A0ACC2PYV0_9HYME|nr:hypothetical protein QAD02_024452 [Eretmocerus hayati]